MSFHVQLESYTAQLGHSGQQNGVLRPQHEPLRLRAGLLRTWQLDLLFVQRIRPGPAVAGHCQRCDDVRGGAVESEYERAEPLLAYTW